MKVAIIGSRGLNVEIDLDFIPSLIISGGAIGIDQCAKAYAVANGIPLLEILPDYRRYPHRVAPLIRNKQIVSEADIVIAYWDQKSRGTKQAIDYAKSIGKEVFIQNVA